MASWTHSIPAILGIVYFFPICTTGRNPGQAHMWGPSCGRGGDWSFWAELTFSDNVNVCFRLQVKGSLLESLIEKRAEYLENCNKSLSTLPQTGEPPVTCSNLHHPDDFFFFHFWHIFKLQEFTVRERLTCFCAGHTRLLETCLCPVPPTFHGSVKVIILLNYFLFTPLLKTCNRMVVLAEENMHVSVWLNLQMTPGGHTENVWQLGSGRKGRTPPNPGGMIPNAERTIISKTR